MFLKFLYFKLCCGKANAVDEVFIGLEAFNWI